MPRANMSHFVDVPEVNESKSDVQPIWSLNVSSLHSGTTDFKGQSCFTELHTNSATCNKLAFSLNSLAHPNGNLYFGIGHALYEVPLFVEPKDQLDREDNRAITTPTNAILCRYIVESNKSNTSNRLALPPNQFGQTNNLANSQTSASAPRPRCVCVLKDLNISSSTRFACMFRICWSPDGSIFVLLSHAHTEEIRVPVPDPENPADETSCEYQTEHQEIEENRLFHVFLDGSFYEIDLPNKDINYLAVWGRDAVFVSSTMSWDKNDNTPPLWMLQRTDNVIVGENSTSKHQWISKNVQIDMLPENPVYLLVQDTLPDGDILMMVEREMQDDSGRNYTEIFRCHVELEMNSTNGNNIQSANSGSKKNTSTGNGPNLCIPKDTWVDDIIWPASPSCTHTPSSLFDMVSPMHAATPYRYTPRNLSFANPSKGIAIPTHTRTDIGYAKSSLNQKHSHRGVCKHARNEFSFNDSFNQSINCTHTQGTDFTVRLHTTKLFGQTYLKKLINSSLPINHIMASQTGCVYCYDLSSAYIDSVWQLGFSEDMTDLVCTRKVAKFHTTDYSYRGRCSASTAAYSGIYSVELSVAGDGERQIIVKKQPLRPMILNEKHGIACPDMESMPWKDVELVCLDGSVSAHRVVLASRCPYFETLLRSPLTSSTHEGMAKISLPHSIDCVKTFVKYLYTQEIQTDINKMGADLCELVVLADYACMPELEEKAFSLIFRMLTPKTAAHIYVAAKKYTTAAPKVNMVMLHAAHQIIQHLLCVKDTQNELLENILQDDIGSSVFRRVLCERHEHTSEMVTYLQQLAKTPGCDFHKSLIDFLLNLRCKQCLNEIQR